MSGPFIVFDLLIPRTDDRTGVVHPPALFDDWMASLVSGVRA